MSSLAATQADGYYLPPEYYEAAQRNPKLNKNQWYQQQQPKRPSATAAMKTVRFELPYNALCQNCDAYISRGTRYNAVKRRVKEDASGNTVSSSSTEAWEFHMNCRVCHTQEFIIQTDPLHQQFVFLQGLQRLQRNDNAIIHDNYPVDHTDNSNNDPVQAIERMQLLQHEQAQLPLLQKQRNEQFFNDADRNAQLRQVHRAKRKQHTLQTELSQKCGWNPHRTRLLLRSKTTKMDQVRAQEATYGTSAPYKQQQQWKKVRKASIFDVSDKKRKREDISEPCPDVVSSVNIERPEIRREPYRKAEQLQHQDQQEQPKQRRVLVLHPPQTAALASLLADYSSDSS